MFDGRRVFPRVYIPWAPSDSLNVPKLSACTSVVSPLFPAPGIRVECSFNSIERGSSFVPLEDDTARGRCTSWCGADRVLCLCLCPCVTSVTCQKSRHAQNMPRQPIAAALAYMGRFGKMGNAEKERVERDGPVKNMMRSGYVILGSVDGGGRPVTGRKCRELPIINRK